VEAVGRDAVAVVVRLRDEVDAVDAVDEAVGEDAGVETQVW
jgi:hypothetical protein